jgi:ABC-type cobalamin/Fe3+-siderophores transport system ATPase subunit
LEARFVADSVVVSFYGSPVLKSASFWARPGEITALLGRNGCGKSTILKACLGIVGWDWGMVRFETGIYLRPRLSILSRSGLFYLPDQGLLSRRRTLRWHLKVLRARFPDEALPGSPPVQGVQELMDKTVWEMSGGEERKADLTLAWARGPSCLLADEPLAGLAPRDQELVSAVIRAMADKGCAVVVTGHDVRPLLALADQVVWMVAGTTHGLGTSEDAMNHEQFRKEYLGPGF